MENKLESSVLFQIESLVSCGIHLGILKDPRRLLCDHVFCFDCLQKESESKNNLTCPTCRKEFPNINNSNIKDLSSALTEKKLIEIIMDKYTTNIKQQLNISSPLSKENKLEIIEYLSKDIESNNSNENKSLENAKQREDIQEMMLENCNYEEVNCDSIKHILKSISSYNIQLDFLKFDAKLCDDNLIYSTIFVSVDISTKKIMSYYNSYINIFDIVLENHIIIPDYIRLYKDNIIITGTYEVDGMVECVFVKCNMDGKIIDEWKLNSYTKTLNTPMILGFDINENEDIYYVCLPISKELVFFNKEFIVIDSYTFDNNHPEYIAYHSQMNQLCISCPNDKQILIFNIDSTKFRTINTLLAVPNMIFVVDNQKIVFLESQSSKLIWLKISNESLVNQNLDILYPIEAFRVSMKSKIIISNGSKISIFQNTKLIS